MAAATPDDVTQAIQSIATVGVSFTGVWLVVRMLRSYQVAVVDAYRIDVDRLRARLAEIEAETHRCEQRNVELGRELSIAKTRIDYLERRVMPPPTKEH